MWLIIFLVDSTVLRDSDLKKEKKYSPRKRLLKFMCGICKEEEFAGDSILGMNKEHVYT